MLRHEAISLPQMLLKEKINKFTEEREKIFGSNYYNLYLIFVSKSIPWVLRQE